jgi:conjugal transfer mating pair stabilization protein TraG
MKFIVLILSFASLMFAGPIQQTDVYPFIVDNATMVDAYWNIFNAIASLFNNPDYINLLRLVFLMGGFITFFTGVLKTFQGGNAQGALTDFAKYMLIGMTLLTLMFSDKSSILVKTNNLSTFCSVGLSSNESLTSATPTNGTLVGNVPTVLAWSFGFLNKVGVTTTIMAKTAFSPLTSDPAILQSRNGFASYIEGISAITSITLDDITANTEMSSASSPTIGSTMTAVVNDCILIPAGQDSTFGPDIISTMKNTGNLEQTLTQLIKNGILITYKNPTDTVGTVVANGVTFSGITPANMLVTLSGDVYTCQAAYDDISVRLNSLKVSGAVPCAPVLAGVLTQDTINVLTGNSALATVSNAENIALNSAIANQIFDSKRNLAIGTEMSFAAGKSMSEFTTNSLGSGYYMAQMLPYLQMGMRAVLYAFFPFIFVVILLPGGLKVLLSYGQSLLWIELWTPTAAILDMFLGLVSSNKFANMYNNKGFNPTNGIQTFSDAAMLASVGGYLYASVPALTYLILKGSAQMLGNITSGVSSGFSKNLDSSTINRDVGKMEQLKNVNHTRQAQGEKMISLAEMSHGATMNAAAMAAGEWVTQTSNSEHLMDAASGRASQDIKTGYATGKTNIGAGGKIRNDVMNAETVKQMFNTSAGISAAKKQGYMNTDGSVDDKNIAKLQSDAVLKGGSDATINQTDIQTQKELQAKGYSPDEIAAVQAATNVGRFNSAESKQNYLMKEFGMGRSDAEAFAGRFAGTQEFTNTMKSMENLNLLAGKGGFDMKTGKLTDQGLKNVMKNQEADVIMDVSNTLRNKDVIAALGGTDAALGQLVNAGAQAVLKRTGQDGNISKNLQKELEAIRDHSSDSGDIAKAKKLLAGGITKGKIAKAAALRSSVGLKSGIGTDVGGDAFTEKLKSYNQTTSSIGENKAGKEASGILADKDLFNEIKNDPVANAEAVNIANRMSSRGKGKDGKPIKFTDANQIPENMKAGIATATMKAVQNNTEVYNKTSDSIKTQAMKKDFSSGQKAKVEANASLATLHKDKDIQKVLDPKLQGGIEAAQYALKAVTDAKKLLDKGNKFFDSKNRAKFQTFVNSFKSKP